MNKNSRTRYSWCPALISLTSPMTTQISPTRLPEIFPAGILWPWNCACPFSKQSGNVRHTFSQGWRVPASRCPTGPQLRGTVLRSASKPSFGSSLEDWSLCCPQQYKLIIAIFPVPFPDPLTDLLMITFHTQSSSLGGIQSKTMAFTYEVV